MKGNRDLELGMEALRLVVQGKTMNDIAVALHLHVDTVKGRLRRLYCVLGAINAAHAVAIAGIQRLLTPEDLWAAAAVRRPGWREAGGARQQQQKEM